MMKNLRSPLMVLLLAGITLYLFQLVWINQFDLGLIKEALHHRRSIFFGLIIHVLLAGLIGALCNRLYVALTLLFSLCLTLLLCDLTKFYFLETHLQPADVLLVNDLLAILPSMIDMRLLLAGLSIAIFVLMLIATALFRYPGSVIYPGTSRRLFGFILPISFAGFVLACYWFDWKELRVRENQTGAVVFIPNFNNWRGDQKIVEVNGVSGYVIAKLLAAIPPKKIPQDYSQATITQLLPSGDVEAANGVESVSGTQIEESRPNIIVVMSESFWSISSHLGVLNEQVSLHPTVDRLQVGNLIAPAFGGGTANTEFEFLTSISYSFYAGTTPFISMLTQPVFSLPSFLRDQGYDTTAIHTFFRDNYNRPQAYRNLGFNRFLGVEDIELLLPDLLPSMDKSAFAKKQFPSDAALNEVILHQLQASEKPQFIFAVSMQNHGRYADDRFGSATFQLAGNLSASSAQIVNTYGTGIMLSDDALNDLLASLDKLPRETIVLFFGDHLPNLEGVYDELQFSAAASDQQNKLKYLTPIALYSTKEKMNVNLGDVSPAALAVTLLETAEFPLPAFYQFVKGFYQEVPVLHPFFYRERDRDYTYRNPRELDRFNDFSLLSFDLLEGQRYTLQH